MTREEKLDRLREWEAHLRDLTAAWDALHALTGAAADGPLGDATWCVFEVYTRAIGREIGDFEDWMSWHWLENDLGAKGREAGNRRETRSIKSLDDLLWAIELEDSEP